MYKRQDFGSASATLRSGCRCIPPTVTSDRISAVLLVVHSHGFVTVVNRILAAIESILTSGLLREQVGRAVLSFGCILVRHPWLHHPLQAFAFRCKIVHSIIFALQRILQVVDHSLLDLLKLLDSVFVRFTDSCVLRGLGLVSCGNIIVVHRSIVIRVLFGIHPHVQAVIGFNDSLGLIVMLHLETIIGDLA